MFCNETLTILSSGWFWGSKVCKFIFAPSAIILNVILILTLIKCKSDHLHINMRCLLINLSLCCVVASGYLLIKSLYTFGIWAFDNPCSLYSSYYACKFQESVFIFFKLPILGSILGLGVERSYAIRHSDTYQNYNRPYIAAVILLITWVSSLLITCTLVATVEDGWSPYCNALFIYDPYVIRVITVFLLPLEIIGVIIYVCIWFITVRRAKLLFGNTEYSLDGRYQRKLTTMLTRAMLPSSILHAIFWITILSVAAVQMVFINLSVEGHLILSQYLFYVLAALHMVLHPIFCFMYSDTVKLELIKLCPCVKRFVMVPTTVSGSVTIGSHQSEEVHFEMLANMWDIDNSKTCHKKAYQ